MEALCTAEGELHCPKIDESSDHPKEFVYLVCLDLKKCSLKLSFAGTFTPMTFSISVVSSVLGLFDVMK